MFQENSVTYASYAAYDREEKARLNMVEGQIRANNIQEVDLLTIMQAMPRGAFVASHQVPLAYSDSTLPLFTANDAVAKTANIAKTANVTRAMPSPFVQASLLHHLRLSDKDVVLVVGAGYGYLAALASQLAGLVFAVEQEAFLVEKLAKTANEFALDNLVTINCDLKDTLSHQDVLKQAPFTAIIFEGSVHEYPAGFDALINNQGRAVYIAPNISGVPVLNLRIYDQGIISTIEGQEMTASPLPGFERELYFDFF